MPRILICTVQHGGVHPLYSMEEPDAAPAIPLGIGAGTVVRKAVIDKNARIGEACMLLNTQDIKESRDRLGQVKLALARAVQIAVQGAVHAPAQTWACGMWLEEGRLQYRVHRFGAVLAQCMVGPDLICPWGLQCMFSCMHAWATL